MQDKTSIDLIKRVGASFFRFLTGNSASQMWGRVFDLSKKKLVELDGFKLYIMSDDYIGASIDREKVYEPHVTNIVRKTLSEGDTFLDVGANIGYFSMLASSIVKSTGNVIAFEPNPQNQQLIYSSMIENSSNINLYPYAVSDTSSILRFTTVGSNGGVVTKHSQDQRFFFYVQSVVMDETLKDVSRIDLIKIDIEAHEPYAMKGMENLLKKLRPKIITEFHPWALKLNNPESPEQFLHYIFGLNYKLSIIQGSGELLPVEGADDVMRFYESLNKETAHLDLFAEPC